MWELYSWRNWAQTKNPDRIPLTLQVQWWVAIETNMLLAVMDGSAPITTGMSRFPEDEGMYTTSTTVPISAAPEEQPTESSIPDDEWQAPRELNGWQEHLGEYIDDNDSDTDIEARVSPQHHPLECGDWFEDEEMMARSTMSCVESPLSDHSPRYYPSSQSDRSAFTTILCDNN